MGKKVVLHPFLFAIYPVFFLFAHNIDELLLRDLFWPSVTMLAIAATTWIALSPLIHNRHRLGLVLSTAFFFFFSYGHLYNAVQGVSVWGLEPGHHKWLFPLWMILLSVGDRKSVV